MKIQSLELRNFKGIGDSPQKIDFAPITLLFGPNSAGKSTILHALLYLDEILNRNNCSPEQTFLGGESIDLGGFQSLVNNHDLNKSIDMTIELKLSEFDLPDYLSSFEREHLSQAGYPETHELYSSLSTAKIKIKVSWSNSRKKAYISSYESFLNEKLIATILYSPDSNNPQLEKLEMGYFSFSQRSPDYENLPTINELINNLADVRWSNNDPIFDFKYRQFQDKKIDEMQELLCDQENINLATLKAMEHELTYRTTNAASKFRVSVHSMIESITKEKSLLANIEYVPLTSNKEAIPSLDGGFKLPDEFWAQETDDINFPINKMFIESIINSAVTGPAKSIAKWIDSMKYIGPIRQTPPRNFKPSVHNKSKDWGSGIAAWDLVSDIGNHQVEKINYWMGSERLNIGYQLKVTNYFEAEIKHGMPSIEHFNYNENSQIKVSLIKSKSSIEVLPADVGTGISQSFPVIALSCLNQKGLVAIEQPELHIHPKLQIEMADLFIDSISSSSTMYLIETHSEHILLRLLKRIRGRSEDNEKLDISGLLNLDSLEKMDLSVIYASNDFEGSNFQTLRVTEDGDFADDWPNGFFDERDGELF